MGNLLENRKVRNWIFVSHAFGSAVGDVLMEFKSCLKIAVEGCSLKRSSGIWYLLLETESLNVRDSDKEHKKALWSFSVTDYGLS